MNTSFYAAASGAAAQQTRMDVIANNMSNISTDGYKTQSAGFAELLYQNINSVQNNRAGEGTGAQIQKTDINFSNGSFEQTDNLYDYAIHGDGFFAVYNPETQQISYTRKGNFSLSQAGENTFILADDDGNYVMDSDMGIISTSSQDKPVSQPGVFDFNSREGFIQDGGGYYTPPEKAGNPFRAVNAQVKQGMMESSNVDLPAEMARVIQAQRAYQLSLKMVQASDEVEQTINSLR